MLDQPYLRRTDNDRSIQADQGTVAFSKKQLVQLPLDSNYTAEVSEENKLYNVESVWFQNPKGMDWITAELVQDE